MGMILGIVGTPPTPQELADYHEEKRQRKIAAFSDKQKQTPKPVLAQGNMRGVDFGLCPTCEHCVVYTVRTCDECFQVLDWSKGEILR